MLSFAIGFAAVWISALSGQGEYRPATRLMKEFTIDKPVKTVTLKATALGLYKAYINGASVTDRRLLPGWTQYNKRVIEQTFDVTKLVNPGTNAVAALVGKGWFAGMISTVGCPDGTPGYRNYPMFRAELTVEYNDGTKTVIGTDKTWKSYYLDPALQDNDIYLGEEYDATWDDESWKLAGNKRGSSGLIVEREWDAQIVPEDGQPVRVLKVIKPVKITHRPSGTILLDYGENLAGVDRITLAKAHPGAVIVVRHAENLKKNGEMWRDNLAFAKQQTVLTCGSKPLVYEPSFTFYGYRYAEVSGWPKDEPFTEDSIVAVKISSVGRRTGTFECSNELINKFFENVLRSQEDNFVDVPTDCPQRCERFGWTGDAQVFCETAMMNYDVERFFLKWLTDGYLCRTYYGGFTVIAPHHDCTGKKDGPPKASSAGWADYGVICPWMLYRKYGNRADLAKFFEGMAKYVDLQDQFEKIPTIGDHLNQNQPTPGQFIGEAYRIEVMRITALAASALGSKSKKKHFEERRAVRLAEFQKKYFDQDGELKYRTQTAAAFAIVYGLCPNNDAREKARKLLVHDIVVNRGTHLATGFLGTPILLRALTECGELDVAYKLLEQTSCPSWLYPVTQGATTVWERWDAFRDGVQHSSWMNSLNHYAFGSAASWLYSTVAGIQDLTEENHRWAGWKHFRLAPFPGGTLTYAKGSFESRYGLIESSWKKNGDDFEWSFTVPEGTVAEIVFPCSEPATLPAGLYREGGKLFAKPGRYKTVSKCSR